MKKIVKLFIMAMMMISVVACSGGNNLSDEVKNTDNPVSLMFIPVMHQVVQEKHLKRQLV